MAADIDDARAALLVMGALLVLASAVPYVLDIVKGRTRPRIFSWIVWTLLGALATAAAYTEGEYPSAALTAAATVETGSIVALGWKYGNRSFERLDAFCLVGVTVGLSAWAAFDSPLAGVLCAVTVDMIAAVPTVRHAWREPSEETGVAYALCAAAAVCSLVAMREHTLMGLLYPTYLLGLNAAVTAIVLRVALPPAWLRRPLGASRSTPSATVPSPRSVSDPLLLSAEVALNYGRHAAPVPTERPQFASAGPSNR